jgi:hypothetical protein
MTGSRGGSAPQRFDKASNETKLVTKIRPDLRAPEASISNPIWLFEEMMSEVGVEPPRF